MRPACAAAAMHVCILQRPRPGAAATHPIVARLARICHSTERGQHVALPGRCCVHTGASHPDEGSVHVPHWVPMRARPRARESTGLAHTLCAWPRRSPQRRHAHSSPTSRARHRSQGHAPSTVPPLSTEVRAVDASSRGWPASAADPGSAASAGVAAEKKCLKFTQLLPCSRGGRSRRPLRKKKNPPLILPTSNPIH